MACGVHVLRHVNVTIEAAKLPPMAVFLAGARNRKSYLSLIYELTLPVIVLQ